jgi:RHS repeat-associated protein
MRNANGSDDPTCSLPPLSPTTRGFTGQEQMPNVCLDNYNARVYNPLIGRFLNADSITSDEYAPQTLNRYSYVDNMPLSETDPSGHEGSGYGGPNGNNSPTPDLFSPFGPEAISAQFDAAVLGLLFKTLTSHAGGQSDGTPAASGVTVQPSNSGATTSSVSASDTGVRSTVGGSSGNPIIGASDKNEQQASNIDGGNASASTNNYRGGEDTTQNYSASSPGGAAVVPMSSASTGNTGGLETIVNTGYRGDTNGGNDSSCPGCVQVAATGMPQVTINRLNGLKAEDQRVAELLAAGFNVTRYVVFKDPATGRTAVLDLVANRTIETPNGTSTAYLFEEVKSGNGQLTVNQAAVATALQNGTAIPIGPNAQRAGLIPGEPTGPQVGSVTLITTRYP